MSSGATPFATKNFVYRVFDEVTDHVNQIIKRQKSTPSESVRRQIAVRSDPVSSCSSDSQCLVNGSKRKCFMSSCVECYKKYQCVKDGKFKCNLQTFTCETGSALTSLIDKDVAQAKIIAPTEKIEKSVSEVKSKLVPNLIATMR